jgi:HEPN domain-containing protein
MSQSSDRHEAERWIATAADDLGAARALAEAGYHAHACFSAQQCAEKAAKAMWYLIGADPWGHSVQALIEDFPRRNELNDATLLIEKAAGIGSILHPHTISERAARPHAGKKLFSERLATSRERGPAPFRHFSELDRKLTRMVLLSTPRVIAKYSRFCYVKSWAEAVGNAAAKGHSPTYRAVFRCRRVTL